MNPLISIWTENLLGMSSAEGNPPSAKQQCPPNSYLGVMKKKVKPNLKFSSTHTLSKVQLDNYLQMLWKTRMKTQSCYEINPHIVQWPLLHWISCIICWCRVHIFHCRLYNSRKEEQTPKEKFRE